MYCVFVRVHRLSNCHLNLLLKKIKKLKSQNEL